MSSRVTRSSARLSAGAANSTHPSFSAPPAAPTRSRKRKASGGEPSIEQPPAVTEPTPRSRSKRKKVDELEASTASVPAPVAPARRTRGKATAAMSGAGPSGGPSDDKSIAETPSTSTNKRRNGRKKDSTEDGPSTTPAPSRRRRKAVALKEDIPDSTDKATDKPSVDATKAELSEDENDDGPGQAYDEDDEDDDDDDNPFSGGYLSRAGGVGGLSSTLRALTGMMSGVSSRLRTILENLRAKDDPSLQLIALQDLSELLLVSNEDNLAGHFSPDQYVKELVSLMQPNDFGEENPEIMLLACRCIANLMEALPSATANVVYSGAVPILCQKLLEIHFIDLAEQALSTLEKISVDFPASIVREGGLTACLTYLDFFATSTQRTAVTTAANCCRNIPEDSFGTIKDVMPILLNVLSSNDQKVVEQGCICVSRVVESFKMQYAKLEELVSADLLKAVLRLLLPGTTNLIGPTIHTQFLRVLSHTARASPLRSVELLKMNVVDTLYQILAGVSPPSGTEDVATKIDSVVIMQALIHRPRDQIYETLSVICELLPEEQTSSIAYLGDVLGPTFSSELNASTDNNKKTLNEKRLELLKDCQLEVRRFAIVLLPTLTDAYSSTVNLNVRQQVLRAQLKMLSNLDIGILEDALRPVPYASYLASILSQEDHPSLVTSALQAAELLLKRLEPIYRYQFHREGVIAEVTRLANRPIKSLDEKPKGTGSKAVPVDIQGSSASSSSMVDDEMVEQAAIDIADPELPSEDEDDEDPDDPEDRDDSDSDSSHSSDRRYESSQSLPNIEDIITLRAKRFNEAHEQKSGHNVRAKASNILEDLKSLAVEIKSAFTDGKPDECVGLFHRMADYFDGDALDSITSYELLTSNIVDILLEVFSNTTNDSGSSARAAFLEAFMGSTVQSKQKIGSANSPSTPFSILVSKLQDLLSRAEHFEVITVHQNSFDSNRSSPASMLAKQLRLKLIADDDSGIPQGYRNIMVSIHAIATFKALDDYLRPRIVIADRPRGSRSSERVTSAIAAYAAALANSRDPDRRNTLTAPVPTTTAGTSSRSSTRKTSKSKPASSATTTPAHATTSEEPAPVRRSARRQPAQSSPAPPPPAPQLGDSQDPLECADETQLTDEDDEMESASAALNSIVDDLEDDDSTEDTTDPSAVNVEVASTGKVTAHKDDGTRVATPSQNTPTARPSPADRLNARVSALSRAMSSQTPQSLPTSSSRPSSYAAALQATPQDWHIEFTVDGQPITNETTIYRAVHFQQLQSDDNGPRPVWSAIHTIKFKRVEGPPPVESTSLHAHGEQARVHDGLPASLAKHPATASILQLLSILHDMNSNLDDVLAEDQIASKLKPEPVSQFVNTKLTAKLNRQLEEPLIVASNCLPSWSEDLARLYPFLFPFETRHLFLQSTSFGYSRSMTRWQSAQTSNDSRYDRHRDERPFMGKMQRQKVRISRTRILESAIKVMELYGSSPSILEVEYFEEVGTGLGPTLEFYSTVSKEFSKKKLKLWRENESNEDDEYAFGKQGLFPAPMSEEQAASENGRRLLHLFKMLGKFVARSMLDSRIIDVSFNPTFFRVGDGATAVTPSLGAVKSVDADLARSLKMLKKFSMAKKKVDENGTLSAAQKVEAAQAITIDGARVEDLGLDFTLPGYPEIQLQPDGVNTPVTIDNVASYVDKVLDLTLGSGVKAQIDAFGAGFSQVFPYSSVKAFTPDELVMLFGRVDEDWSLETLMDSIKADHGFNLDSKSVRNLLHAMSELSAPERRDFLQFVTGSPKLPIGGFKSLTPMFTVVCKPSEPPFTSDDYLPSVMTCVNYLKMPDYSSMEILRNKLNVAIKEGQGAFHLS
ncbi:hypothetical protein EJ05DRAFT_498159 [Pseudovirgaria hyperparasitica]|uniref:HECT-type E3 ubiquitin transferase n=1 Tax=Pseudovirgaria hyperparasitica TaxID=470096 RepID=A0A6A6WDQ9_9PEZI|nr:uncharacterized protein EJ05DRAFT_498159 [Pseudovirgaria hyperparasitica]KAF2760194.1 hypothetical protein EJ05DRAFT_498159 [Pseudovirgaria hyperparasitica]